MAETTLRVKLQLRSMTTAQWTALGSEYVPLLGEPCIDTTLNSIKIGDGTTAYANLPVFVLKDTASREVASAIDDSVATDDAKLPTVGAVEAYVGEKLVAAQAMILKGQVDGTTSTLPTTGAKNGWSYLASESFVIGTKTVAKGDLVVLTNDTAGAYEWTIIESGNEITKVEGTSGEITLGAGQDGLHGTVTLGLADVTVGSTASTGTVEVGGATAGTFTAETVTVDAKGRVTSKDTKTVTVTLASVTQTNTTSTGNITVLTTPNATIDIETVSVDASGRVTGKDVKTVTLALQGAEDVLILNGNI